VPRPKPCPAEAEPSGAHQPDGRALNNPAGPSVRTRPLVAPGKPAHPTSSSVSRGAGQNAFQRVTAQIAHRGANLSTAGQMYDQHFAVALDSYLLTGATIQPMPALGRSRRCWSQSNCQSDEKRDDGGVDR
jgi:hypothetical protein